MTREQLRIAEKEELRDQLHKLGWSDVKSISGGYTFHIVTADHTEHWMTVVDKGDGKNFSSSFENGMPIKLYTSTMALINKWLMPKEKRWVLFMGKDPDEDDMYLQIDDMYLQIDEDGVSVDWDPISYSSDRLEELKGYYPRLEKVIDTLKLEEKK